MKTKITILLISLFVLAFSAQAFAAEKSVALIVGSETQGYDSVDSILVQLNADLALPPGFDWNNVIGDFKILDGITNIPVSSINTLGVPAPNYFNLFFDTGTYNYGPDKNDLKLHYINYSGTPIVTQNGNLQNTSTAINIDDGVDPLIIADTLSTNNTNPFLGEAGDVITFAFESDEALAAIPVAPQVTFTIPELKATETVTAVEGVDNLHWSAQYTIPAPGSNLDGNVSVSATFWDVHANAGSLAATDTGTDDSFVIVKNYDPAYTYVGAGFDATTLPAPVSGDTDDIIYLWNVFNTVQEGIDAVASGGFVNVTTGTYTEDLTIATTLELLPYVAPSKAYDLVTLKGVATVAAASWPLADPNIDIQATGVSIHNFKIEAPDYAVGFYSSGIVVGATNATIINNVFYNNTVATTDDISQAIQTYNTVDVSGLNISTNTFTNMPTPPKWAPSWGYEGIYINNGGAGLVNIEDNTFGGNLFRGITVQRSNCNVEANTLGTDLVPVSDDWMTAGAWVGIWAWDDISDIVITGNTIQGTIGGTGFNRGIRLGSDGGSTFTNLTVTSNEIYYNKNGIYSQSAAGITITGNAIENNTLYGVFCDTGTLNAEDNWWGSTNGPTHADNTFNVTAQGDVSSDNVDYVPWYDTDMYGTSFWPVEILALKGDPYFSSLQTAIDAAAGGETIECKAGTFTENVNVNKVLTLIGASSSTVTVNAAVSSASVFNVTANSVSISEFTVSGASDGGQAGIYIGAGVSLCNIFDNVLTGNYDGIWLGAGSNLNTLTSNTLTGNYQGFEVYIADDNTFTSNNANSNANYGFKIDSGDNNQFTSNIANSNTKFGFYVVTGGGGGCSNTTFTNNTANLNTTYGIRINGGSGTTLTGNTFDSNGVSGIRFKETMTNLTMTGNTVTNNPIGIEITDSVDDVSTWAVNYNHIVGNTNYGISNAAVAGTLSAEDNWWGSANGPTHVNNTFNVNELGGQGDAVTDYVDYVPWYDTDMSGSSFAPVDLYSVSKSLPADYFSSLQTAIDAANNDDEIYCYAGTFTEDFVVDKALKLLGEELEKQSVTLLGEQEVTSGSVFFENFIFDPDGAGTAILVNSSAAAIDEFEVYGCTFTLTTSPSVGVYLGGGTTPHILSNAIIYACVFNGPDDKIANPWKIGGSFGNNVGCPIYHFIFSDNEVNKCSIPINLVNENINGIGIHDNDFYDTDGVLYFWNDSGTPPNGVLSNLIFENNYIPSSNSYGVAIGGTALGGPIFTDANFGSGNRIHDNAFEMSGETYGYGAVYMADNYTGLLDASDNWWGDAYGPENDNSTYTPPAPLKGRATVSDRVEYAPWYDDGTNAATGRGWVADAGATLFAPVHNVTQDTYHSSIQRGVDGATTSDSISCLAGTFDECVTIDKNIRLAGASSAKGTTYLAPSFAHMDSATVKNVHDSPYPNLPFQSVLLVDYTGTTLTTINDFVIDGSSFNTGTPASSGYFAGIFFDDCAGTVTNITFDDIYTLANKGMGIVIEDDSGTDKTTEIGYCTFNNCPSYGTFVVFPNAIANIHHNSLEGSTSYYGFLSASSTTASVVESNSTSAGRRGVNAYSLSSDVKVDITNNTFDFSGYDPATNYVDMIVSNDDGTGTYSVELDIDGNTFIGNWPLGTSTAYDCKAFNTSGRNIIGTSITNNTFTNINNCLWFADFGAPYGDLTNVVVQNNTFTNISTETIRIGEHLSGIGTMSINYNSFDTNPDYVIHNTSTTEVDAEKNWWGDATGPDDEGDINPHTTPLGGIVTTYVDFIPWYATSTVTTSTEYVMTHSGVTKAPLPRLAYADAIQPGIDAAAGDYYYVQVTDADSPYTEDLVVDNKAYLYGEDVEKDPLVQITGTHVITADDVTFDFFTLTPGSGISGTVITINSASQIIDGTTITGCQFDMDTSPSIGVYVGGGTPTNKVEDTEINYCTFNGPADMISNPFKVGGQYGGSVGCEIAGLLFGENYVNHGSIPINIADKTIIGLDIIYNDFSYTDGVIYFWAEAGTKSPTGQITESTFENNYVDATNSYGVGFDVNANFTGANYGTISVTNNYFDEDIPGDYGFDAVSTLTPTVDLAGYVLDATENWWGSTDGPDNDSNTFNILTQGVEVSDNVDFVQWYDSGAGYDDPGWNPSGNLFAPVVVGSGKADPYYASIQAAVNGASSDDEVVCYEGTFYEDFSVPASVTDLSIHPYGITKDLDDVTIKGQDKVEASLFPLADPNIEILGSGTGLEGFTIVAPTYVEGYYSSGIVVGATNVDIGFNTFINNTVNNTDDISQAIQTYKDVDCSTLEIGDNTFTDNLAKGDWGYEAIYINPGSGETAIFDNEFTGMCLRAITIEDAGPSEINGNTIETTLPPVTDWLTSGAYQGINLQGDLSDIYISDNYIGGSTSDYGFAQGIRLGSDGDTFTDVLIGGALKNGFHNTIKYNTYGILCKSAAGVAINYNVIEGNDVGVQNDDTAVKTVLDATYNYWGAADGPSFTFDYGIGSGSGDEVSEYVDFNPWYEDSALNTLYTVTMSQFLLSINPASPYVDNYFDLRVCAADANGIRDFSYDNLADFSSSHVALSVPEEQLLVDGFKEVTGACISTLPFDAADHLTIYAWEYITNPPDYYSNMTDIVIQELNDPAAPTNVDFADNPGDNGGWILLTYTLSVDDPFYTAIKDNYGVSYYVVEIDTVVTGPDPDWHFLANISCYDNGLGTDEYTALLPAPASDTEYNFRMAAVYNPTKLGGFDENHISYTQFVTKDAGAQSAWQTGSAAPMDNLPAYANMKVFLQGPYSNGVMTDGADKPLTSPYDGETISAFPLPNDQIVDWVYVELRFAATGETVKEANAFLLTDGSLVNVDGKSSLPFFYTTDVDYYLVIQHRNHLAMMSSAPHTFGDFESQATTIDLTSSGSAYNNGFIEVDTGVYAMYDGDANHSELVNVNDAFDLIDHFGMSGYLGSDLNLSGYVNVNDAYELIGNFGVGTSVPGSTLKDGLDVGQNVDFNVPSSTETKTLECTLEIKNVQVIAGVSYSFDVYITRNTEDWSSLGNLFFITETWYSDLALNFNGSALANPVVSGLSPVATGTTVTTPSLGKLSISLTDGGITVPMTETKLLTVTFDVTDPDATSMLSWNTEDTSIINEASGQYYTTDGTLSLLGSDDSTLPVVLSLFTAQYLDNTPTLYWETESETDNMGWFVYRNNEDNFINAQKVSELLDGHGTTSEMSSYTYEDTIEEPVSGDMCYYWLESIDYGGIVHRYSKVAQITIPDLVDPDSGQIDRPEIFGLLQNAPNPFVNGTRIVFNLHQTAQVELKIYNIKGELVKDLYSGISDYKSLQWNGTDDTGKQLSPGIYFYNLTVNGKSQEIKKLILMR